MRTKHSQKRQFVIHTWESDVFQYKNSVSFFDMTQFGGK